MTAIIIFFGLLTFATGLIIIVNPELIFGVLRENIEKLSLQLVAVGVRVLIGVLLIVYAGESRFPVIIEILGWLSLIAATTFGLIGRRRFQSLMTWALSLLKPYGRLGGLAAALFGGFIAYAFI